MARLDAARVGAWRGVQAIVGEIERGIDSELRADWDIPIGWFDVLASLQRLGGRARPLDVANDLRLPPSSISRRFDRLEEEGWIARHRHVDDADLRAVDVELTRTGRRLWREMNVSYRRAVQALFSIHLSGDDIVDLQRVLDLLIAAGDVVEPIADYKPDRDIWR
jgi:DNA-binding MarR family transcriptional regulator